MIGQKILKSKIIGQLENNTLSSFCIFTGSKGSGKKTLIKEIFKDIIYIEPKVDAIREMINMSNKMTGATFAIPDSDSMSISAQNAILKVVEECKNNNRFILTLEDINNVLPTIQSRAVVYILEFYSREDLKGYGDRFGWNMDQKNTGADICENIGELILLDSMNISSFYSYVQKVVDNIAEVSGANVFKIADKIAFKEEPDKYDLRLFFRAFRRVCFQKLLDKDFDYFFQEQLIGAIMITTRYLNELRIRGVNRLALFDSWILSIRKEWM